MLIEPGVIRTPFYDAAIREPEHPAYAETPAISRADIPPEQMLGDQTKVATAMIRIAELEQPPHRQLLGSDAYTLVHDALTQRLEKIEEQRETAMTTDRDDFQPVAG